MSGIKYKHIEHPNNLHYIKFCDNHLHITICKGYLPRLISLVFGEEI